MFCRRNVCVMQEVAEGRTGIASPISGFVVAEDQSFEARLRRRLDALHARAAPLALSASNGFQSVKQSVLAPSKRAALADAGQALLAFATLFAHVFRSGRPKRSAKGLAYARLRPGRRFVALIIFLALSALALAAAILLPEQEAPDAALRVQTAVLPPVPEGGNNAAFPASDASPLVTFSALDAQTWQAVRRPIPMFHLESPDLEGTEFSYAVYTRGKGARLDTLSWAPKAGAQNRPRVHLIVERYERDQPAQKPLFADLAARASERHVTLERMAGAIDVPSKFGTLQTADATLIQDAQPNSCLVFRRVDMSGLTLAGWYCGTAAKPADRVSLTCFLDRLDLLGAGQDQELKRYFSAAERNRSSCASARQSGRKITWMDHEAPIPPLKLSAKKP